jgi:peptide/nickel transport system substrate-binding protein
MSASGFALTLALLLALASGGPVLVFAQPAAPSAPLPSAPPSATPRREVRIGIAGVPATLDPMATLEGAAPLVLRQVLDTLVVYRESSTDVDPALATRWTVSRDGLVWSFTLRDGARFHDGTPLTAREAAASLERWLRPETGRAAASLVVWGALLRGVPGVVKEVRAADARTLQIVLSQPYAPLLTVLAHPAFGITKATTGADGNPALIGSGPYRVSEGRPGRLVLDAVTGHWSGGARADRLVFVDIGSDDQAETEMDARSVDVWMPPGPPRRAEGALSVPGLHVGFLAFQTEKEPFSRKKVRQAIAAAIDPPTLGAALGRAAVPLVSFLPPGVWARRDGPPLLGGTRETVAGLLREGGWAAHGKATLLVADDPAAPNLPKFAEAIRAMLQAVDVGIQLRVEPPDAARAATQAGEHELVLAEALIAGGDPHLFLYPLSTSEGVGRGVRASNFSFYRSPRLDDVLIRAAQLSFRVERQRLYQRAQAMLADDLPWIPLYARLLWAVARPEVRGLRLHPTGLHRLNTVWLEPAQ